MTKNWNNKRVSLLLGLVFILVGLGCLHTAIDNMDKAKDVGNASYIDPIRISFGVALITAGVLDLLYFSFIRVDHENIIREVIQNANVDYDELGVVVPFRRLIDSNYLKEMRSANDQIRILQTFAADNTQIIEPIETALKANPLLTVEILLADPEAAEEWLLDPANLAKNAIVQRAIDIEMHGNKKNATETLEMSGGDLNCEHSTLDLEVKAVRKFRTRINETIKFVDGIESQRVSLRLYRNIPYTAIYQVDNNIYVAPFTLGLYAHEVPALRFSGGLLRRCYETHFKKVWNAESTREFLQTENVLSPK